jgi:hypothetical protein
MPKNTPSRKSAPRGTFLHYLTQKCLTDRQTKEFLELPDNAQSFIITVLGSAQAQYMELGRCAADKDDILLLLTLSEGSLAKSGDGDDGNDRNAAIHFIETQASIFQASL